MRVNRTYDPHMALRRLQKRIGEPIRRKGDEVEAESGKVSVHWDSHASSDPHARRWEMLKEFSAHGQRRDGKVRAVKCEMHLYRD